ncbi:hypothetical protein NCCP133_06590 [Cytobacillus sp. NCCP-133]|nr:hypothetical protein NCCP133_06590 [Cytobacillus sp. NCCP-133]
MKERRLKAPRPWQCLHDPESLGAATWQTEMWKRLSRDDRQKTVPLRRYISFWKESAYDLEGVGAGS